jgi:hypothetical protein
VESGAVIITERTERESSHRRYRGSYSTSQKIPRQVFATGQEQILATLMDDSLAGQHLDTVALGTASAG